MEETKLIEYNSQRILTTAQLAEYYETDRRIISNNYTRHAGKSVEGEDYFRLEGEEKRQFLNCHQIDDGSQNARVLYLWTEYGALLHAKSLNTGKAWDVFRTLRKSYFRVIHQQSSQAPAIAEPNINSLWDKRLSLFGRYNKIPAGYWCVFGFVAGNCYMEEFRDVRLVEHATPDGSIGKMWCQHLRAQGFDMSLIKKYRHRYPDHRGEVWANIYPNDWLGEFWTWFHEFYLKVHWPKYVATHQLQLLAPEELKQLPPQKRSVANG